MKKIILSVVFQIGVNVIGIPDYHTNSPILFKKVEQKSKFHR